VSYYKVDDAMIRQLLARLRGPATQAQPTGYRAESQPTARQALFDLETQFSAQRMRSRVLERQLQEQDIAPAPSPKSSIRARGHHRSVVRARDGNKRVTARSNYLAVTLDAASCDPHDVRVSNSTDTATDLIALAPKAPIPMTTSTAIKTRRFSFRASTMTYAVVRGCLVVTLTRDAEKRWGCWLPEGHDGPDYHSYRVALATELRDLARDQGAVNVEIYTSGKTAWLVDQMEILD